MKNTTKTLLTIGAVAGFSITTAQAATLTWDDGAGIASGEWIELGDEPVRIDILFGEMGNRYTSGILQIEREGDQYPHSYWGQPQWPLFLKQKPSEHRAADFKRLNNYLENSLRGSFSIPENAIWQVIE